MKKIICLAVAMLFVCSIANAGMVSDYLNKLQLDNGMCYSFKDHAYNYSGTVVIVSDKQGKLAINLGFAGVAKDSKDKIIGTLSYNMLALKNYLNIPVLDLIIVKPYIYGGYGKINGLNAKADYGAGAILIQFPFGK